LHSAIGAVIIGITYGIKTKQHNDRFIQYAEDAMEIFIIATKPGAFLVDFLPILQYAPSWFPGATYKKNLPLWRKQIRDLLDEPVEVVKNELVGGILQLLYQFMTTFHSLRAFTRPQWLMNFLLKQCRRSERSS
jgi:hypothetical protein